MMGLGPMGSGAGGYSSSSTSNLSALAPPFTVDRFNPKPNSNPMLHYSDPYAVDSFSHEWQYPIPSAPTPELAIDSTGLRSPPFCDDYQFSASATISPSTTPHWLTFAPNTEASNSAFAYGGDVKPYYSPYAPPLVGEDSLLVKDERAHYNVVPTSGLNVTSPIDYTQSLFDLECGPRWIDSLRLDDGKRAKRVGLDGSFSSERANAGGSTSFKYELSLGGCHTGTMKNTKEDSGISYQTFLSGREGARQVQDKSCLEQDLSFYPYEANKVHIQASSSTYPESYSPVLSCEMHSNYSNYQISHSPFETCVDTPLPGPVSVIRSSPAVVIRPPPVTNGNLGKSVVSRKLDGRSVNLGGIQSLDLNNSNPSKRKDFGLRPSSETQEESFEANLFDFPKKGNDISPSSSVRELSSPLHCRDTYDRNFKARFVSQLPDRDLLGGFAVASDNFQVIDSTEDSSDFVDHHNPAEDSPCWRGAPSSQFSQFDIETGNSNHVRKKLDEFYGFDHEEHQNIHSIVDSSGVFSEKDGEGYNNNENQSGGFHPCSSKKASLHNDAKGGVWVSAISGDDPNMPRIGSGTLNNLTSVFHMNVLDTSQLIGEEGSGTSQNDVSEAGAVAVHAAEEVLASPASQEDATEPDPKLNVPKIIKTMHNLSALLLFHLSSDTCSLDEESSETLKHTMSNLGSSLCEKLNRATNHPEPKNHVGDTSDKLGESREVFTISGNHNMANEAANPHIKLDYHQVHEGERTYSLPGKKDDKSPVFSPLRDDLDITSDDDMAKAIKKVLDENFHLNEDMDSQALLFKSLWLDAEAKLCSITYKARFDRMKILMDETKLKAQQENENIAQMLSKVSISKPTLQNISSLPEHAEDVETSVMARFNILKSREDNPKPLIIEKEQQNELVDGEHEGTIMARFNILKSRKESCSKSSSNIKEEQESKMIEGENCFGSYMRGQTEDETTLNVAVKPPPHFLQRTGSLQSEGKFSCGYETLDEFHLSVRNDPIIDPFKKNRMVDQTNNSAWPDSSSSSDWEHVMKDELSWKNS
ncbi:hypothetical protein ABFS82_06G014100 [Erythranthe guttata]|uniref:uncharacterized protein LOC105963677 n=1 Tax=Erythranthe guttata TaxID=4155 RepID=UPI00064D759B|nr:PREDICTED: uncharacterized protein LOC105963677 [Erythranthe guttata]|eukprot:XP_012843569.1 PREDICTED: uncharacterized protein LOC105963677 [Erythranthe guttata]